MEPINRNNYEAYFIDYFDGKLTSEQEKELKHFLLTNPDIEEELSLFENITIPEEKIEFPDKNNLKRNTVMPEAQLTENEYLQIAHLEGDLSNSEKLIFNNLMKNNDNFRKEKSIFFKTKLKPDTAICFENKENLKQKVVPLNYRGIITTFIAVAACFLLFFVVPSILAPFQRTETFKLSTLINDSAMVPNFKRQETKVGKNLADSLKTNKASKIIKEKSIKPQITYNETNNTQQHENETFAQIENQELQAIDSMINLPTTIEGKKFELLAANHSADILTPHIPKAQITKKATDDDYLTIDKMINKKINDLLTDEDGEKMRFWDIAANSVEWFSKVTGKDIRFEHRYNQNGELEGFAFQSENYQLRKNFKKSYESQ